MSQVHDNRMESTLPRTMALVRHPLQLVEQMLADQLSSDIPIIDEMVRCGAVTGGKRFRPALLLLAAHANGEVQDHHIMLATAVEMIHAATLVHDDIIDKAQTRRHVSTINHRWGNQGAVLFGDYLFTQAFYLASLTGMPEPAKSSVKLPIRFARVSCSRAMQPVTTRPRWVSTSRLSLVRRRPYVNVPLTWGPASPVLPTCNRLGSPWAGISAWHSKSSMMSWTFRGMRPPVEKRWVRTWRRVNPPCPCCWPCKPVPQNSGSPGPASLLSGKRIPNRSALGSRPAEPSRPQRNEHSLWSKRAGRLRIPNPLPWRPLFRNWVNSCWRE